MRRVVYTLSVALLVLVGSLPARGSNKLPPPVEVGETLWLENCWQCHGKRALGDGPLATATPTAAPALAGRVPADREVWVTTIHRGQGDMPAFGPVMDRVQAGKIVTWLDALDPDTGDGPSIHADKAERSTAKPEDAEASPGKPPPPKRRDASPAGATEDDAEEER